MRNNTKGISAVVATVLIILITVAAITIIWAAIIPMIKGTLEQSSACLEAVQSIEIVQDFTCQNASNNYLYVQIGATKDTTNIKDIQIILSDAVGSTMSYNAGIGTVPAMNGRKVHTNTTISGAKTGVMIAPIISSGAGTKTCDSSIEFKLPRC